MHAHLTIYGGQSSGPSSIFFLMKYVIFFKVLKCPKMGEKNEEKKFDPTPAGLGLGQKKNLKKSSNVRKGKKI